MSSTVELWSERQQKVLFWAPKIPALVSLLCSAMILYLLIRDHKTRLRKVFNRLWFGISLGNLLVCLMVLIGSTTAPDGTYYGALGTEGSCKASAAIFHFVFVVTTVYNGSLGVYYYVSVHKKWNDEFLKKNVEPWMHGLSISYALIGMAFGLGFDMYGANETFLYCWAAPSPFGCRNRDDDLECTSGNHLRPLFIWMAGLVELNAFSFLKLVGVFLIYRTLLKQHSLMNTKYTTKSSGTDDGGRSRRNSVARETGIQAYLFLSTCLVPYVLMIILRQFDMFWNDMPYPASRAYFTFAAIAQTLFPLQGVLNMVIFFRPKIKQRQRENPDERLGISFRAILAPASLTRISSNAQRSSWAKSSTQRVAPKEMSAIPEGGSVSCLSAMETSGRMETSETLATLDSAATRSQGNVEGGTDRKQEQSLRDIPLGSKDAEGYEADEAFQDSSPNLFMTSIGEIQGNTGCVAGEDLLDDCRDVVATKRRESRVMMLQTPSGDDA